MTTFTTDTDNNITAFRPRTMPRGRVGESAKPVAERKATDRKRAKGGAPAAKGAPTKGKANKKATPAKNPAQAKKAAKAKETAGPREGSKTAQVVALLQRKNGQHIRHLKRKSGAAGLWGGIGGGGISRPESPAEWLRTGA